MMAVYEHLYGAYEGEAQTAWSRFLVIPRYGLRDAFGSKIVTTFFVACFVYPLIAAILIYLRHNANALALLQIDVRELLPIDASFFRTYVAVQGAFALLLTVLVGPPLVSRDLGNNALPLYLCRPLSRTGYVLGKGAVLAFLLSAITWLPGIVLFLFQSSLAGAGWFASNIRLVPAILIGSAVWIVLLSLLALAISALVKWRVVASGAMLGLFFVPGAVGAIVNEMFLTRAGNLLGLWASMRSVWDGLFGLFVREVAGPLAGRRQPDAPLLEPPLWCSWIVVALACAVCVWLLSRKVRAYEVIK